MSIVRIGSTQKYSEGWETAFGSKKRSSRKTAASAKVGRRGATQKAAASKKAKVKKTKKRAR